MAGNIVFIGIKHCGKSTHGKLLAARLKRRFLDTDELLSDYCMREYGMSAEEASPRAVMSKHGEVFFRRAEAAMIREVLQEYSSEEKEPVVISLGGGVPSNKFLSSDEVKALGTLVNLIVDPEIAYSRIASGGIPPFLAGDDPHGKFLKLSAERMSLYAELADVQVNIACDMSAECLNEKIYEQLLRDSFLR